MFLGNTDLEYVSITMGESDDVFRTKGTKIVNLLPNTWLIISKKSFSLGFHIIHCCLAFCYTVFVNDEIFYIIFPKTKESYVTIFMPQKQLCACILTSAWY